MFTLRLETVVSFVDFFKYSLRFSSGLNNSSIFDGRAICSRDTTTSRMDSMMVINDVVHAVRSLDDVVL